MLLKLSFFFDLFPWAWALVSCFEVSCKSTRQTFYMKRSQLFYVFLNLCAECIDIAPHACRIVALLAELT